MRTMRRSKGCFKNSMFPIHHLEFSDPHIKKKMRRAAVKTLKVRMIRVKETQSIFCQKKPLIHTQLNIMQAKRIRIRRILCLIHILSKSSPLKLRVNSSIVINRKPI
jgi:hypothetical protein